MTITTSDQQVNRMAQVLAESVVALDVSYSLPPFLGQVMRQTHLRIVRTMMESSRTMGVRRQMLDIIGQYDAEMKIRLKQCESELDQSIEAEKHVEMHGDVSDTDQASDVLNKIFSRGV